MLLTFGSTSCVCSHSNFLASCKALSSEILVPKKVYCFSVWSTRDSIGPSISHYSHLKIMQQILQYLSLCFQRLLWAHQSAGQVWLHVLNTGQPLPGCGRWEQMRREAFAQKWPGLGDGYSCAHSTQLEDQPQTLQVGKFSLPHRIQISFSYGAPLGDNPATCGTITRLARCSNHYINTCIKVLLHYHRLSGYSMIILLYRQIFVSLSCYQCEHW